MGNNGIHRAKLWQIGGFALNNTATNLYLFFMNFISYYLVGFVGVGVVLASTLIMNMRIWDGVTDPFIGYVVDKTDSKFGKNRPFIVIGNIILALFSYLMVHLTHKVDMSYRFILFIVLYMIYIIGYTFQCVVTKSAQTCLTNDPKQRPIFTIFDGIYNTILFAAMPVLVFSKLLPKYNQEFTAEFFHEFWLITAAISAIFSVIAVISIAPKDKREFFGLGKVQKISLKDYWEVLSKNRAIQMLVISASTDKLALTTQSNATVLIMVYAIVCGNKNATSQVAAYTAIPTMLMLFFGVGYVARYLGQRKAMLFGTIGALITCILSIAIFYIFDPTTLSLPGEGFTEWNIFTVLFIALYLLMKGFTGVSGNIVIPMTADCADYEVYRSGKYMPGLMGTLFSFVDKLISSLGVMVVGLACAMIGFTDTLPTPDTPASPEIKVVAMVTMYGLLIFGLICNLIAMKFYPLTREKMAEIQQEIAEIKAREMEKQA